MSKKGGVKEVGQQVQTSNNHVTRRGLSVQREIARTRRVAVIRVDYGPQECV